MLILDGVSTHFFELKIVKQQCCEAVILASSKALITKFSPMNTPDGLLFDHQVIAFLEAKICFQNSMIQSMLHRRGRILKNKNLSDQKLHAMLLKNVKNERVLLTEILHQLREVEKRRLFSDFKCSSTFDYAVRILGYSEPQAGRRIQAMRLMRDVPEVESKLTNGELTLTSAAQVQQFIKKEEQVTSEQNPNQRRSESRIPLEKKKELIEKVSGLSSRKTEQALLNESKKPRVHKEKTRRISEDRLELKFSISPAAQKKMQKLKGLLAHSKGDLSLENFFEEILDLATTQLERKKRLKINEADKERRSTVSRANKASKIASEVIRKENVRRADHRTTAVKPVKKCKRSAIPAEVKREVWQKTGGQCKNCDSTYALEFEHRKPVGKGGSNSATNLELLCRSCNQRAAIRSYGQQKMSQFL